VSFVIPLSLNCVVEIQCISFGSDSFLDWKGYTDPRYAPKNKGDAGAVPMQLFLNTNTDPAILFHLVGHEMIHAEQIASGEYWSMVVFMGEQNIPIDKRKRTKARLEMEAYMWNLEHLWMVHYPGAYEFYSQRWWAYYRFILGKGPFPESKNMP